MMPLSAMVRAFHVVDVSHSKRPALVGAGRKASRVETDDKRCARRVGACVAFR